MLVKEKILEPPGNTPSRAFLIRALSFRDDFRGQGHTLNLTTVTCLENPAKAGIIIILLALQRSGRSMSRSPGR